MSIWAGIKYAINSTIGTSKFVPLDKLLTKRSVLASDNVLWKTSMGSKRVEIPKGTAPSEIICGDVMLLKNDNLVGTVNISTKVTVGREAYSSGSLGEGIQAKVHLYRNGVLVASSNEIVVVNGDNRGAVSGSSDINFTNIQIDAGDELKIMFEARRYASVSNTTQSVCYITANNNLLTVNGVLGEYVNITGYSL